LLGGSGKRLSPLTNNLNKHLLPIYNKPMYRYSLATLMLANISEITVIVNPQDFKTYKLEFLNFSKLGIKTNILVQDKPRGIADAFLLIDKVIRQKNSFCLALGDNIVYGPTLGMQLRENKNIQGALIFAQRVSDPTRFGVVEFNDKSEIISIAEK